MMTKRWHDADYEVIQLNKDEKKNLWLLLPYLEDKHCFTKNEIVVPVKLLYRYSGENWRPGAFNPLKLKCKVFDATTNKEKEERCFSFIRKDRAFYYKGQQMRSFDEQAARMILKNADEKETWRALNEGCVFVRFNGIAGILDSSSSTGFKKVVLNS